MDGPDNGDAPHDAHGHDAYGEDAYGEDDEAARVFAQGGPFGEVLAGTDWPATVLGPTDTWPRRLVESLRVVLACELPMALFWGPRFVMLYNQSYAEIIGSKHPGALGAPAGQLFPENWDDYTGPMFQSVVDRRRALVVRDQPFRLIRHGFLEQTYFDISFQPVLMDDGTVGGVLCFVSETTGRVLGERRLGLLADIGVHTTDLPGPAEVAREIAEVLSRHADDVPFAHLYLPSGTEGLALAASTCRPPPHGARARLPDDVAGEVTGGTAVTLPAEPFLCEPGATSAEAPPAEALALPLSNADRVRGVLVAGISPLLPLAGGYRDFLDILARAVTAALSAALAHEEQRRRAEALAELDRAKTTFFSNVSHELRTPLTLFLGPVQDALAREDRPEPRRRLEMAERNALRLLRLVNTLLDVTRAEAGALRGDFEPVDLSATTAELAGMFRSAFEAAGLALDVDCPPLPQPVCVDREMYEKIVLNLLSNALKFTPSGGARVVLSAVGDRARLTVSDTGIGVPEEELPRLFERFHRVHGAPARTHEGSGIGLALVKDLVQQHGGTVTADSRPGGGTTFTVEIPFGTAHLSPPPRAEHERVAAATGPSRQATAYAEVERGLAVPHGQPTRTEREACAAEVTHEEGADRAGQESRAEWKTHAEGAVRPGASGHGARPRLLIADDNSDMRAYLYDLLHAEYDLGLVPDGRTALAAAVEGPYDLVLTDAMMPGMDGFELVRALRASPRTSQLPIVMLTARAGEEASVQGIEAGADDYLAKPFSSRQLLARVRANLELSRLRDRILSETREHATALAALADAGLRLSGSLEPRQVLETAGDLLVPQLADEVRVEVLGDALGPDTAGSPDPAVYTSGHGAAADDRLTDAVARVLRGGPAPRDPDGRLLAMALTSRGRTLGALAVARRHRPYSDGERTYLEALTSRIAVAYDNATRYQNERRLAVALQRALLPQALPQVPGVATASYYRASALGAEVGGDWYDVIQLPDGAVGLAIGDVMGHDVDAAIQMGSLRSALHAYALESSTPSEVLARLDAHCRTLDSERFATCLYAVYEPGARRLRYASAGHLPPLLVAGDRTGYLDLAPGMPLGVARGDATDHETLLLPGTGLLLFTDGLVEHHTAPLDDRLAALRLLCRDAMPAPESPHAAPAPDVIIGQALGLLATPGRVDDDTALLAAVPAP
ncbi:SpoIIE family protein phosphatase [Streptomyces sp. CA-210063]|uniref:SpoIIE family protein phosphatase n=1 Tax=Streptomyces sp. CA-210063 TaxID=2801029 RepID=UPI00214B5069|nr:SpoIIE family protein phosphatase [Streptomyces sp. CA-210063]UUU33708.1 SpoIIE family protein phosphatase [Streptomyces sp. CA-210063]